MVKFLLRVPNLENLTDEQRTSFRRRIANGCTPNIALILATKQAPMTERKDERWGTGKYMHGLAEYPGDKNAIVGSRADAKRRVEQLRRKGVIDRVLDGPANSGSPAQQKRRRPKTHG